MTTIEEQPTQEPSGSPPSTSPLTQKNRSQTVEVDGELIGPDYRFGSGKQKSISIPQKRKASKACILRAKSMHCELALDEKCEGDLSDIVRCEIDRIKPKRLGGLYIFSNIQRVCRHCNRVKNGHLAQLGLAGGTHLAGVPELSEREKSIENNEGPNIRKKKWSSREGEKHDTMWRAYRITIFDLLHGKNLESYIVVPNTPGKIRALTASSIIAGNVGVGVNKSYNPYLETDECTILLLVDQTEYVERIVSGSRKKVPRTFEYIFCKECFVTWEKRKQDDPLAQFEILDHAPFETVERDA